MVELGRAEVRRPGADVTLVALASTVPTALAAAERLRDRGVEQAEIDAADTRAREEVAAAVEAAKAAPPPAEESAFTDVWADGGAQWRT